jgi:quercetin dioxygenase-like cupin family protein
MKFTTDGFQEKVTKPWGEEIIFTPEDLDRTGKIANTKKNQKWSFQYHDQKEETICLLSGKALLWLENNNHEIEKVDMKLNYGYTVLPNQKHRLEALEDSWTVEVSSKESGTTIRIEDDYKRTDETEEVRKKVNRGWQK